MSSENNISVSPSVPSASSTPSAESPNYDAEIDIAAQNGAFSWSVPQLALQEQPVQVYLTPSGLHAEAKIFVDNTLPKEQQRVAVFFDATTQNGLGIDFTLSLTPIDAHFQPTGPKLSYKLSWVTSPTKPAFLQGPVYLKDLKAS